MPCKWIGKVRRVNKTKGGRGEQLALFALAGCRFDQFRRVPLAEIDLQTLQFEPAFEQINLGRFARPVQPLHCNQATREIQFRKRFHYSVCKAKSSARQYNVFPADVKRKT